MKMNCANFKPDPETITNYNQPAIGSLLSQYDTLQIFTLIL
jgi:hypothetical protein